MQKFYLLRRIKYRLGLYNKPHRTSRAALRILAVILILSALSVTVENRLGTLALELGQTAQQRGSRRSKQNYFSGYQRTKFIIRFNNNSKQRRDGHIRSLSTDFFPR